MPRNRSFILDGAHNAEACQALCASLPRDRRILLVSGMVVGHDPVRFFEPLAQVAVKAHMAPIDFLRAVSPEGLVAKVGHLMPCMAHETIQQALEAVVRETNSDDLIVVTGSFYLVGQVGAALGAST